MNLSTENKLMDLGNRLTCGCQGGGRGSAMDWESGFNICKPLPFEWISNKIVLYSIVKYN